MEKNDRFFLELQNRMILEFLDYIPDSKAELFLKFYTENFAESFRDVFYWIEENG